MRSLSELHIERRVTEPPSNGAIRLIEVEIGRQLPNDYLAFLREYNGGDPAVDTIKQAKSEWAIDHFYSIVSDLLYDDGVLAVYRRWRAVIGAEHVPVAVDGGDNQFVLRFCEASPDVCIVIHDDSFRVVKIADSFSELVAQMSENPNYI